MGFFILRAPRVARLIVCAWTFVFSLVLTGCSDGGSDRPQLAPSDFTLSGSVGDGPVVNADLTLLDANGDEVSRFSGFADATYEIVVPQGTPLPVKVVATGGLDLVTERALDFELLAVSQGSSTQTVNLSPLTTLMVRTLECDSRKLSAENLRDSWDKVRVEMGMGITMDALTSPMEEPVDSTNAAEFVLVNEAVGEIVRRAAQALTEAHANTDAETIVETIACDLSTGGQIDGNGPGVSKRIASTVKAAQAATLAELVAGQLAVGDRDAMARMDAAVAHIQPAAQGQIYGIGVPHALAELARRSLLGVASDEVDPLLVALSAQSAEDKRQQVRDLLSSSLGQQVRALPWLWAGANSDAIEEIIDRLKEQRRADAPVISLNASEKFVPAGSQVLLSWASADADSCVAGGAWSGEKALQGVASVGPVSRSVTYELTCIGVGGTTVAEVAVQVSASESNDPDTSGDSGSDHGGANDGGSNEDPAVGGDTGGDAGGGDDNVTPENPPPGLSIRFAANPRTVERGGETQLTWSTVDSANCTASGPNWSGAKAPTGAQTYGPIDAAVDLRLECQDGATSAVAILQVGVAGELSLAWRVPELNTDGTPVTDLAGYNVYAGTSSQEYTLAEYVEGGQTSGVDIAMPVGRYYVAMTAISADGVESALSNEIVRDVQ